MATHTVTINAATSWHSLAASIPIVDTRQCMLADWGCGWGRGRLPKDPHCQRLWCDDASTRAQPGGSALSELVHAPLVPPYSRTTPSLIARTLLHPKRCEHIRGGVVRGKQLRLAAINPRDVIHKLLTINSLSVCKCG